MYKTIILPVVLCGGEDLSFTFNENHRFRVFEYRVLRIFGPKWNEVARSWKNFITCIFHQILLRNVRSVENIAHMKKVRNVYTVFGGKAQGKVNPPRPSVRVEVNIRIYIREIAWESVECIHLAQVRDK
jgi:hypothetical protein